MQAAAGNSFAGYFPTRPAATGMPKAAAASGEDGAQDEDARIEAMMHASSAAWTQNSQLVGQDFRPRAFRPVNRPAAPPQPMMPLPPNYVCFRCGQKGHFITACPTNADPNFDKPKLKKSTGIPRAFLKPVAAGEEGAGGVLVTADGSLVQAVSNDQEWQKIASTASSIAAAQTYDSIPAELQCKICSKLLSEPVACPSCSVAYCEECILGIKDASQRLKCPCCAKTLSMDDLVLSEQLRKQVDQFVADQRKPVAPPAAVPAMFPFLPGMPPGMPFPPPFPFMGMPPPPVPPAPAKPGRDRSRSPGRSRRRHRSRSRSPRRSYRRD